MAPSKLLERLQCIAWHSAMNVLPPFEASCGTHNAVLTSHVRAAFQIFKFGHCTVYKTHACFSQKARVKGSLDPCLSSKRHHGMPFCIACCEDVLLFNFGLTECMVP